ncbi:MAG TPA: metal-dependent transcriptional regulator [Acidimicrobiales bacterium]|nr:metal-dependent transcriptional regulator [Acidimicrobiales bacterium]
MAPLAQPKDPAPPLAEDPASTAGGLPSPAASRYLEAVWYMEGEGEPVRPGRLAAWLGVSAPTVSVALQRLARDGLVSLGPDRRVAFTDAGRRAAAVLVRRHRVVECWLTHDLGLDWAAADAEADRLAFALSETVLDRLYARLGRPATCPHGNAIPGASAPDGDQLVSLASLAAGRAGRVVRISEMAEHRAPEVLELLHRSGLVPGAAVAVAGPAPDPGVISVEVGGADVTLARTTAAAVWVQPD